MKVCKIELTKKNLIETEDGYELIREKSVTYPLILTKSAVVKSMADGSLKQDIKDTFLRIAKAKKDIEKMGETLDPIDTVRFLPDEFVFGTLYTAYRGALGMKGESPMALNEFVDRLPENQKELMTIFNELVTEYISPKN